MNAPSRVSVLLERVKILLVVSDASVLVITN